MTIPTQLFDSHCHYNLDPLEEDWRRYQREAQAAGVAGAMVVGTNIYTSRRAQELRARDPEYFRASLGLHPEIVTELLHHNGGQETQAALALESEVRGLAKLASSGDFDAWGEIGLDYYHLNRDDEQFAAVRRLQEQLLRAQLALARADGRPLIFHVRDERTDPDDPESAYHGILQAVQEAGVREQTLIFHCFSGNQTYLERVLALPHSYVSFAGNVTFKSAHALRDLAAQVPAERLLIETDAPFLSPEPRRGQPCQPAFLAHTAALLHEQWGVDLATVWRNSLVIFAKNKL